MGPTAIVQCALTERLRPRAQRMGARVLVSVLAACLCSAMLAMPVEAAKRKSARVKPPDLKITSVTISPMTYSPQSGPLEFAIEVELPKELDGTILLEVSSLISSASKRSMRFLASRQPVHDDAHPATSVETNATRRVAVRLMWDGMDQAKQMAPSGTYSYEVKAKLLAVVESGPRTHMVSWPKRGTLLVK